MLKLRWKPSLIRLSYLILTSSLMDIWPATTANSNQTLILAHRKQEPQPSSASPEVVLFISFTILQATLLHPKFHDSLSARWIRLGLGPLTIFWWLCYPFRFPSEAKPRKSLLPGIFCGIMALKSIEWTFARGPYYLRDLKHNKKGEPVWEKGIAPNHTSLKACGGGDFVLWLILLLPAQRGLRWSWGITGKGNPYSFTQLAIELVRVQFLGVCSIMFLLSAQDHANQKINPQQVLIAMGIPNFLGIGLLARCLHSICFMLLVYSSLELGSTLPVLFTYLLYPLTQALSLPPKFCEALNPENYPLQFNSIFDLSSLAHFWGKCWHQKFRRPFLFCGGKPAISLAKLIGASENIQKACGAIGVFSVSGIFHAFTLYCMGLGRYQNQSKLFHPLPTKTFLFFFLQSFGVIVESTIIPRIPKILGSSRLWTSSFLLLTAPLFADVCGPGGILRRFPPLSAWTWREIFMPVSL